MIYLIAVTAASAAALVVVLIAQLVPATSPDVKRRVQEVAAAGPTEAVLQRRQRRHDRTRLEELLEALGRQIVEYTGDPEGVAEMLTRAGYRKKSAPAMYWGIRFAAAAGFALAGLAIAQAWGANLVVTLMIAAELAAMGYVVPMLLLKQKVRRRQHEIVITLPDALDLLVVCVEAGLGLNQAFVRVADEIRPLSQTMGEELHLLNLEIRAGHARDRALRNLFDRTGVEDIRVLATMLIQADRFGTSIANALRVHSETLRDKRRQRAEEAAAKTTIKIIFPLVLCIFPAMFVVLVGPGMIQIAEAFMGLGG
ncbi:MAG: type II secretion system F family protein [Candidatus Longimicrobiales bacterium M2_2A_002]